VRFSAVLLFAAVLPAMSAAPGESCKALRHHGQMNEARTCFNALLRSGDAFSRAEGLWGLNKTQEANDEFRAAEKTAAKPAELKTEWGLFFLEHSKPGDAAKLFTEAIAADANFAPAYLALARVAAQGFDKRSFELCEQALDRDPKLFEAHELLAYLQLEDNAPKKAAEEAQKALAISNEALDGMAVLASIDWLNSNAPSEWMTRILKIDPVYGEAYATGAHFFEINRRYDEAIQYYRKALELNAALWPARSQLGVNLLRQGLETEARQNLERCYEAGFRDAETVNTLRLLDRSGDFETFKTANTELRLNKKEAALLRPYVEPEMQRAIAVYERKYKMKLPAPVHLELYPNHEDFIVRTLGLPGQGGLLGVTFGLAVAMDSPSARAPGQFDWASTMWHEFSHVFVLSATHHLVPRWFTEGLAVHEEGAASPSWGDRMTPDIVSALEKKQLLPVLELDTGFLRPKFPTQVTISYYEAGRICDFISQKWGDGATLGMIHSYADRKSTEDAMQTNLHVSAAEFDKEFMAWLEPQTANTVKHFADWKKGMKEIHESFQAGKMDDAIRDGAAVRDYYPEYTGEGSAYELMAEAYRKKGNKTAAIAELEKYRGAGGTGVETLKKLAAWEQESGNSKEARTTLATLNYIYPEDEETHRKLGTLLLAAGDADGAVREAKALVALKPADTAESHYELAKALTAAHRVDEAKDQVVMALEAAPGFKPAQQLLLQLSQ
jgi:tetratricopeptide (TPR) repeat protein